MDQDQDIKNAMALLKDCGYDKNVGDDLDFFEKALEKAIMVGELINQLTTDIASQKNQSKRVLYEQMQNA